MNNENEKETTGKKIFNGTFFIVADGYVSQR